MEPGSAQAGVGAWICDQSISAQTRPATVLGGKVTPDSPLEPRAFESWVNFLPTVPGPSLSGPRLRGGTALSSGSPRPQEIPDWPQHWGGRWSQRASYSWSQCGKTPRGRGLAAPVGRRSWGPWWAAPGGREAGATSHSALIRKQGSSLPPPHPSPGWDCHPARHCLLGGAGACGRVTGTQLGAEHVPGMTPRREGYFNLESCLFQLPTPNNLAPQGAATSWAAPSLMEHPSP